MNETINFTLQNVDIGQKSASCFINGVASDSCLYQQLCAPMNRYFLYAGIFLLSLELLSFFVIFIYRVVKYDRLKKKYDIDYYKFKWWIESKLKFGFMLYCIVVLYYNFFLFK